MKMNDMDYLNVVLNLEKNISNSMSIFMNETCSEYLYEDYFDMFTSSKDMARDIYEYILDLNNCNFVKEDDNKILDMINKLQNKLDKLEN